MEFDVRKIGFLAISTTLFLLTTAYLFFVFSTQDLHSNYIPVIFCVISFYYVVKYSFGYISVQKIILHDDKIEFLPIGHTINISDIASIIKTSVVETKNEATTLHMKVDKKIWIPCHLLWLEKNCLITLQNDTNGVFCEELQKRIKPT